MKAAIVERAGQPPVYGHFTDPAPSGGLAVVRVSAAAISHVTKSRASGAHYSADGQVPLIPGVDGVGVDEHGRRVWFILPEAPFGSMAERCLVDARRCIVLPDELGDVEAAAMAIPGMSSWAALVERAQLRAGETVLVNGATGASGRLAIQVAKHLGAKRVVATGRNTAAFDELRALGADATIALTPDRDALETAFKKEFRAGVDIVLDYVWGPSAETLIVAAAALAIPGMSSWAALVERAQLRAGETVLVNGATGASGRLAIQVARHLGAKKVVATGRNAAAFDELHALGADVTIALTPDRDAMEAAFKAQFRDGVDVVLDYLWGPSAETLIVAAAKAGAEAVPIRYVQIGAASGGDITLPGAALRSSALQLMGSGIGSIAQPRILAAIRGVLEAAPGAGFKVATRTMALADVARARRAGDAQSRIVLVP